MGIRLMMWSLGVYKGCVMERQGGKRIFASNPTLLPAFFAVRGK
jgi:hypothetical protein